MRLILAAGAAVAVVCSGFAAMPSSADTLAPVGAVSIDPSISNVGTPRAAVSWSSVPSNADGTVVCVTRGNKPLQSPSNCESQIVVSAPGLSTRPITVHPHRNYTFNVFAYEGTTPITYSAPVSVFRHGTKLAFASHCASQAAGSTCRIVGTLTDIFTGSTLRNRTITLWSSKVSQPAKWNQIGAGITNRQGQAHTTITLSKTRLYQWRYDSRNNRELDTVSGEYEIIVSQ